MAEVLQVPREVDGQSFYQSSGLRRSHPSSSSLFLDSPALSSSPQSSQSLPLPEHNERIISPPLPSIPSSWSEPSSPPDFPSFEPTFEESSTPLEKKLSRGEDISFPDYGGMQFYNQSEEAEVSLSSSDEQVEDSTTGTTCSDSPLTTPTIADDTAIKQEPKQHVDYLSHDWREEDIWSSWRHIVSQRKVYGQRSRLENASWRTWAQSKYRLPTVSPETLNWLKESDVTWLYGPLKPAESHPITSDSEPSSHLSKSNSFITKKPILKKRSMSEVMLQKSISASSLVKQAAAAVQAQQSKESRRSTLQRVHSDFVRPAPSQAPSRDQFDYFASRSSSEMSTPCECQGQRHIRFDEKVEQCIAVDCKEGDFDEDESEPEDELHHSSLSDSSSDDGIVMRRRRRPNAKKNALRSRSNSHNGRKTIETLPATTLKYRTDSPEVPEQHHTFGRAWGASRLSPSPSQETLKPSHPSSNFLIGGDEDDGEVDTDSSWSFGASNPKSSLGASSSSEVDYSRGRNGKASSRARSGTPAAPAYNDDEYSVEGMRRTNSGMLMPDDDDEDEMMAVGLFGRVSETINTAKDIAHVLWNVGWRK